MTMHNANNERIKRRYFAFLKEAKRHSEPTVDAQWRRRWHVSRLILGTGISRHSITSRPSHLRSTWPSKRASGRGISLHAGVASEAHEREKLERLSLTTQGNIRYRLQTPYRDGTTDVVFAPELSTA